MTDFTGQDFDRYHILESLGQGGMASVYKAYDTRLERDVAVKIIRTDMFIPATLQQVLKRFEREAKSLARLSHPNIVSIIDYGEHDGVPFLVMEYLPGGTLKDRLRGQALPWQDSIYLLLPIASALHFSHQLGIIHRDVKPSNILITLSGEPMLSDFGVAKLLDTEVSTVLTGTGVGLGTPAYMAPEQWIGNSSPLSDMYSLGVVMYEMVTGRKPFTAETPVAILLKQASEPLPRPRLFVPDLPEKVEKVIIKALAKKPENRYPGMGEFITALESLVSGQARQKSSMVLPEKGKPENLGQPGPLPQVERQKIVRMPTVLDARVPVEKQPDKAGYTKPETPAGEIAGKATNEKAAREVAEYKWTEQIRSEKSEEAAGAGKQEIAEQAVEEKARQDEQPGQQGALGEEAGWEAEERLRKEAEKRSHPAAWEQSSREAQARQKQAVEIARLQPAVEIALTDKKWGKARLLLFQLKNMGPQGRILADHLRKRLPAINIPFWAWVAGGLVLAGIVLGAILSHSGSHVTSKGALVPTSGGYIFFTSNRTGKAEIYYLGQHGKIEPITNSDGKYDNWSPVPVGGGYIYFTSNRTGKADIYYLGPHGKIEPITNSDGKYDNWSPVPVGGGYIYFASNRTGKAEIYYLGPHGKIKPITNSDGKYDNWSPVPVGGGYIYFTSNRTGKAEIYFLGPHGKIEPITNSDEKYDNWSPVPVGGGYIYFTSNRTGKAEIYYLGPHGKIEPITNSDGKYDNWSPVPAGGGYIYFASNRTGKADIYYLGLHGNIEPITNSYGKYDNWIMSSISSSGTPKP